MAEQIFLLNQNEKKANLTELSLSPRTPTALFSGAHNNKDIRGFSGVGHEDIHVSEKKEEHYSDLWKVLEKIKFEHYFGPLITKGFGELDTLYHTPESVLRSQIGLSDDEITLLQNAIEDILSAQAKPQFKDDDLSDGDDKLLLQADLTLGSDRPDFNRMKTDNDDLLDDSRPIIDNDTNKFMAFMQSVNNQRFIKLIAGMLARGFTVFDMTTDVLLLKSFIKNNDVGFSVLYFATMLAPFIVVWSAGLRFLTDKGYGYIKAIYSFPFTGFLLLALFDAYLVVEAFLLNPFLYIWRGRFTEIADGPEIHSYMRLKAVAELVLENIPQFLMQLYLWFKQGSSTRIDNQQIFLLLAVGSAVLNIIYIVWILNKESKENEVSFIDYSVLTLTGRFGYTPFVKTIANGEQRNADYGIFRTKNSGGITFSIDAIRKLIAAVNSKDCVLVSLVMGDTCVGLVASDIEKKEDTGIITLWQLRDACNRRSIKFTETYTDKEIKNNSEYTLRFACDLGLEGVIRELLELYEIDAEKEKRRVDINKQDPETGLTALMNACRQNFYTPARLLMQHRVDKVSVCNLNVQDNSGMTALIHCCIQKQIEDEILRLLIRHCDLNIVDNHGRTAFSYLCEAGAETAILIILSEANKKCNINIPDKNGVTAFMYSCRGGHFSIVQRLLKRTDLDVLCKDNLGRSAFMYSVLFGRKSITSLLLSLTGKRTINVNECATRLDHYQTPLMYAAVWEHRTILRMLLRQKGIDVNAVDKNGRTALMLAAKAERPRSMSILLQHPEVFYNTIDKLGFDVWGVAGLECRIILDVLYPDRFEFEKDQRHVWRSVDYKMWYLRLKTHKNDDAIQKALELANYSLPQAFEMLSGAPMPARYYLDPSKKDAQGGKVLINFDDEESQNEEKYEEIPPNDTSSQLQAPQLQAPQLQAPQLQASQLQAPQLQASQLQSPQLQAPQEQAPQGQASQEQAPQEQAPQEQASQEQAPQEQAPQLQLPQFQSYIEVPQTPTSQLEIPQIDAQVKTSSEVNDNNAQLQLQLNLNDEKTSILKHDGNQQNISLDQQVLLASNSAQSPTQESSAKIHTDDADDKILNELANETGDEGLGSPTQ